jgi:PhzF family phenazine biosynthesis protein
VKIPLYHLDAFTSRLFAGNPAAVVPLEAWPSDAVLQSIAAENNLPETAYIVGSAGDYQIRWMTPRQEIDLCGHATLASAWVIANRLERGRDEVRFQSKGGTLVVRREGELYTLDFPSRPPEPCPATPELVKGLGKAPREVLGSRDYLAVFESEDEVRGLVPDMESLAAATDRFAVIVTAPGRDVDFVSRFFAPRAGIPEDPVTGSAHCTLTPYWARRLGRSRLKALQVSPRGGELLCEDRGPRVHIGGRAVLYLEGTIEVAA